MAICTSADHRRGRGSAASEEVEISLSLLLKWALTAE